MPKVNMTTVIVNTSFEGFHRYENAPKEVSFLRDVHRHIFHVNVEIEVFHDDRELEFILIKQKLDRYIKLRKWDVNSSCEQIGEAICRHLTELYGERKIICTVMEDNENGGRTYYGF